MTCNKSKSRDFGCLDLVVVVKFAAIVPINYEFVMLWKKSAYDTFTNIFANSEYVADKYVTSYNFL